jgi:uncharacterized protein (DUF488 family)
MRVRLFTIGHGRRPVEELVECLREAEVRTLVDVRRLPRSQRNPQFNQAPLAATLEAEDLRYRHAEELGGLRTGEPGAERFACLRTAAFRSYAARMARPVWQEALAVALDEPAPCFMCAETSWLSCHRWMLAELLEARGHEVVHLIRLGEREPHRLHTQSEMREGRLYVCGQLVA